MINSVLKDLKGGSDIDSIVKWHNGWWQYNAHVWHCTAVSKKQDSLHPRRDSTAEPVSTPQYLIFSGKANVCALLCPLLDAR